MKSNFTLPALPDFNTFSFYRGIFKDPIFKAFKTLLQDLDSPGTPGAALDTYYSLKAAVLGWAFDKSVRPHYARTPWQDFLLASVVGDENPLTLLFEAGLVAEDHPFTKSMHHDFELFLAMYHFDWSGFLKDCALDDDNIFSAEIFSPLPPCAALEAAFESGDVSRAFAAANTYIFENGLGIFELNQSFKLKAGKLCPVTSQSYKTMDSLVGYDKEKKELIANTAALIHRHTGLNVLLQGDMGTGKSTMVKALLDHFKDTRLKMIEFKKDQLSYIPAVVERIKHRPYPFILFIDDLSFEEDDADYKLFKNILEGSLEENPDNVLIYATSNKRHLVTETRSERENAVHTKDVLEEKLSLSSRFGLVLTFVSPDQNEYLRIVGALAQEAGLAIPTEQLNSLARQWELRHLNRSGRTAEQFIDYLKVSQYADQAD
ncbi:MAG: ATP-binding protein [Eubacterium sp.]|nr:ATP-binding protein [Eubacterium sp.]